MNGSGFGAWGSAAAHAHERVSPVGRAAAAVWRIGAAAGSHPQFDAAASVAAPTVCRSCEVMWVLQLGCWVHSWLAHSFIVLGDEDTNAEAAVSTSQT